MDRKEDHNSPQLHQQAKKSDCLNIGKTQVLDGNTQKSTKTCALKERYQFILRHHPEWSRLLHFIGVGAVGFIGNLLILTSLLLLGANLRLSIIAGIITSTLINFIGDRVLVFDYARDGKIHFQFIGFILVCLIGGIINYQISIALISAFDWLIPQFAVIAGILVATGFNFFCLRYLVFKKNQV